MQGDRLTLLVSAKQSEHETLPIKINAKQRGSWMLKLCEYYGCFPCKLKANQLS